MQKIRNAKTLAGVHTHADNLLNKKDINKKAHKINL